jgi:hypothetical protein
MFAVFAVSKELLSDVCLPCFLGDSASVPCGAMARRCRWQTRRLGSHLQVQREASACWFILTSCSGYAAAVDWPVAHFYKELMEKYPQSKVGGSFHLNSSLLAG